MITLTSSWRFYEAHGKWLQTGHQVPRVCFSGETLKGVRRPMVAAPKTLTIKVKPRDRPAGYLASSSRNSSV